MNTNYKNLKLGCYAVNVSMSIVGNLPALLFLTFRSLYGLSYSLLGLLVLINFTTQLLIDLIFSFFSHKFDIPKTLRFTPVLTIVGLLIYALWPFFFPQTVYTGLVIGTIVFSCSSGLAEVLISPVMSTIPSPNPDREMSKLHSVYAWGVVFVIIFSTLFLLAFGSQSWQWLTMTFITIPLFSIFMFAKTQIPSMQTPGKTSGALAFFKNKGVWLCVVAIFLGGAAECTMAQWASSYLEQALSIPKVWGDVFGVALFGLTLGLGRTLYAKIGKNLGRVLFFGALGASVCYFIAATTSLPLAGLAACALTGFCTSMLWPGNLSVAAERFPSGGVVIFAAMAAGGDLGASVGPQLVGIITDAAIKFQPAILAAQNLGLSPEQFAMKIGMLVGMIFPVIAIPIYFYIWKKQKKNA